MFCLVCFLPHIQYRSSANTLVTHLCPTSSRNPSTNATYVSPTIRFDVNEPKKRILLGKQPGIPLPHIYMQYRRRQKLPRVELKAKSE